MEAVDALEGPLGSPTPLLQAGQLRRHLRGFQLQTLALLAQIPQLGLQLVECRFGSSAFCIQSRCLLPLLGN